MNSEGFKKLREETVNKDDYTQMLANLLYGLALEVDKLQKELNKVKQSTPTI